MTHFDIAMLTISTTGFVAYLAAYSLLQFGYLCGQSKQYRLLMLAGASCILIRMVRDFNLGSALIQVSWILITLCGFLFSRSAR